MEAKDKQGHTLRVGSVCMYVPTAQDIKRDPDPMREKYVGRRVIVRAIKDGSCGRKGIGLRIDDDLEHDDDADDWSWSAWVRGDQLVLL